MKRYIVILLLNLLASSALFAFDYEYKGVVFKCKANGSSAIITGFNTKAPNIVVPATVVNKGEKYRVKTVSVFLNGVNYLAETVILEEGIEEIGKFCFTEFRRLENVSLPTTIMHVGKYAFRKDNKISFSIPSNLTVEQLKKGDEIIVPEGKYTIIDYNDIAKNEDSKHDPIPIPIPEPTPKPVISDVDKNIPVTSDKNPNTYCIIIANEKYNDVSKVEFAERDGSTFKEYCVKTLGVPKEQIKTFINASYTDMKRAVNWMETISTVTDGEAKFIFYYAGHGIPSEEDRTAYLIPTDGFPKDLTTCFKLSDLYGRIGKIKTQSVIVIMDACFSGIKRGKNEALIAARGVAIKVKREPLSGNTIVFSATSDDQTALSYESKGHGMFTYFLLNALQKSKGKVTLGQLYKSVSTDVKKNSYIINEKLQTPSVYVSSSMNGVWEKLYF